MAFRSLDEAIGHSELLDVDRPLENGGKFEILGRDAQARHRATERDRVVAADLGSGYQQVGFAELLEDRFGSNGDQAEDEKAFREHRAAIEQAASDKYDAGQVEPHVDPKIVVTAWDMASPLSRKM